MRIAFAGTPEFAKIQLEALLSTSHEIVVVYTQPDKPVGRGQLLQESPVKQCALARQVPVEQPVSLKTPEAINTLARYHLDLLIVAAYGMILPASILRLPRFGCVNVHASLLPRWRGASPIQQAILAGDRQTGITLMQMDEGLDTGAILVQAPCDISQSDTAATLHDKLAQLGAALLVKELDTLFSHPPVPQENALATHASKIHKQDGLIKWQQTATEIDRQIRAYHPWPMAYTHLQGHLIRIWQAKVTEYSTDKLPGTIIAHTPQGIVISTGQEGALLVTQAQLPGKKALAFSEILKGHADLFAIGQQFS